jgi:cystathionine beta-lyase
MMRDATLVTTLGRDPEAQHGIVNPPTYRASTVLFPTLAAMEAARPDRGVYYGRYGTPTTMALQDSLAALEGGHRSLVVGSGKTAITSTLLALLQAGDHLLVADSAYGPDPPLLRRHARQARHRDHLLRPAARRRRPARAVRRTPA